METDNDWTITCNRYVAYIDIMGFKDMVARIPHAEVYEMMKRIDQRKKYVENIDWLKQNTKLVKTTTYSDSIIMYSKNDSYDSFDCLVTAIVNIPDKLGQ